MILGNFGYSIRHMRDLYRFFFRWLPQVRRDTGVFKNGYALKPGFLSRDECCRILEEVDNALHKQLPDPAKNAFIIDRSAAKNGIDEHVYHLMNYQDIAPWIIERLEKPVRQLLFDETGKNFRVWNYSVQVDWPDTKTKRGYHSDGFMVSYKVFIYLNDVADRDRDGPYTVIAKSHTDVLRKIINLWVNFFKRRALDDMRLLYSDRRCTPILADAGTAIVSCQMIVHKGWHHHTTNKRYMMVLYLLDESKPDVEWTWGREMMLNKTLPV